MNEAVKTETQVPSIFPVHIGSTGGEATGVGMLLAVVTGFIFYARRKMSRDNTEVIKDRAEGTLLTQFIEDRERLKKDHEAEVIGLRQERELALAEARKAWTAANDNAVENARLKSENEYQQRELARLTKAMADLQTQFDDVKTQLQRLANPERRYLEPL